MYILFQREQNCSAVRIEDSVLRVELDSLGVLAMRGAVFLFTVEFVPLNLEAFRPFDVDGVLLGHDDGSAKNIGLLKSRYRSVRV